MRLLLVILATVHPLLSFGSPFSNQAQLVNAPITKRQDPPLGNDNPGGSSLASVYDYKKDRWEHAVHKSCNDTQTQIITTAIAEAGYLAHALKQWSPGGAYENSMYKYMGLGTNGDQKSIVQATVDRQFDIHQNVQASNIMVKVLCDENVEWFKRTNCRDNPKVGAYSVTLEKDDNKREHIVAMCPVFFEQQTLAKMLQTAREKESRQKTIWAIYRSRASIWMHETFHFAKTVTDPKALDHYEGRQIYGPSDVAEFAAKYGAVESIKIADAWTLAALSNMMMRSFGLKEPPSPDLAFTGEDPDPVTIEPTFSSGGGGADEQALFTKVSGSMAEIDPNDYASKAPPKLPPCDENSSSCNYVSQCGEQWVPIESFERNGVHYSGFQDAVLRFCGRMDGSPVAAGHYLQRRSGVGVFSWNDPRYPPAWAVLIVTVQNNQKEDTHEIDTENCASFLLALASKTNKGKHCYGDQHHDSLGGYFWVGNKAILYHAEAYAGDRIPDLANLDTVTMGPNPPPGPEAQQTPNPSAPPQTSGLPQQTSRSSEPQQTPTS